MTDLLQLILLTSLFIFGFHYVTLYTPNFKPDLKSDFNSVANSPTHKEVIPKERELLWWYRYYVIKYLPLVLQKPLIKCVVCMASPYTTLFYWSWVFGTYQDINYSTFIIWVVAVVAVAGLNRLLRSVAQI